MNYNLLLAFALGMIVLAISPGPGVVASVSKAISDGFVSSLYVIAGLAIGDVCFLILALLGMSTISSFAGSLFFIIKIAGGLYLIYLGVRYFFAKPSGLTQETRGKQGDAYKTFAGGFMVTMSNPKPILFYASVVPTIINVKEVHIYEALLMIGIVISISFIVLGTYCYLATMTGKFMGSAVAQKRINYVSGVLMIAVGLYIAFGR
jgi:threonine/homoserine/homoserine lactone efflux protein